MVNIIKITRRRDKSGDVVRTLEIVAKNIDRFIAETLIDLIKFKNRTLGVIKPEEYEIEEVDKS